MIEYAVLDHAGNVWNVCMTSKPIELLRKDFPQHIIKRLDEVPIAKLKNYRYWEERP